MSAYNDIDQAREAALTTVAAIGARYSPEVAAWLASDVEDAYQATESWYDWGESEAGAFWSALADMASGWPLDATDAGKVRAWLQQAGVAVASSEATAQAQSVATVVADTAVASAQDAGTAVQVAADPKTWILPVAALGLLLLVIRR